MFPLRGTAQTTLIFAQWLHCERFSAVDEYKAKEKKREGEKREHFGENNKRTLWADKEKWNGRKTYCFC